MTEQRFTKLGARLDKEIIKLMSISDTELIKLKLKDREIEIDLPVKKICGITCDAKIKICRYDEHHINIIFKIENKRCRIVEDNYFYIELFTISLAYNKKPNEINGNDIYNKIYEILPLLKINKLVGKFTIEDSLDAEELTLLFEHPNIEINSCCVCLEICSNLLLKCKHIICIDCFEKILPKMNEDGDGECIFCPLCREEIAC
jgi:hypothetical protein